MSKQSDIYFYNQIKKGCGKEEAYYKVYLKSDYWYAFRKELMKAHNKCEICKTSNSLRIHHLNYDNLFHEIYGKDVIILCKECHDYYHRGYKRKSRFKKYLKNQTNKKRGMKQEMRFQMLMDKKDQDRHLSSEEREQNRINEEKFKNRNS